MHRYKAWNGPMPTTGQMPAVTTGTAIKTMLQLATPSNRRMTLISWGFRLNGPPNGAIDLIETDVAATVTAHVAAGIQPVNPGDPASLLTLGATASGYTSSGEGAITQTRLFDYHILTATNGPTIEYDYQFMPNEQPVIGVSKFLRVRANMGSAVNMVTYICWDE